MICLEAYFLLKCSFCLTEDPLHSQGIRISWLSLLEIHLQFQMLLILILEALLPEHCWCFMKETTAQAQFMVHGNNETHREVYYFIPKLGTTHPWAWKLFIQLAARNTIEKGRFFMFCCFGVFLLFKLTVCLKCHNYRVILRWRANSHKAYKHWNSAVSLHCNNTVVHILPCCHLQYIHCGCK